MKAYFLLIAAVIIALVFPACKRETWRPGISLPKEKVKVGVIFPNEIDRDSIYDHAHHLGILEMQKSTGIEDNQVIRRVNVPDTDPAAAEEAILSCIAEGANIIIAASWGYMDVCEKLAEKYPSVVFAHATGHKFNAANFTNYSVRLYHARYLSGVVAGMQTKTGQIGFVAAKGSDNSEVTGGINAFAIGAQEANPQARIYVRVTNSWYAPQEETNAANALIAAGCDVIAAHCNTPSPQIAAQKAGVLAIGFNSDMSIDAPDAVVTSVVPRWGAVYIQLVKSVINGTFTTTPYFYGLAERAVDITPINESLAVPETRAAVRAARQRVISDNFNVFDGVLKTSAGRLVGEEGKTLSDDVIVGGIDWYYQNVVVMR